MGAKALAWSGPKGGKTHVRFDDAHFGLQQMSAELDFVRKAYPNPPDEAGSPEPACPRCGSEEVFPIAYGVPTLEMVEESLAGRVEWGGCVAWAGSPEWGCSACGHDWRGHRAG